MTYPVSVIALHRKGRWIEKLGKICCVRSMFFRKEARVSQESSFLIVQSHLIRKSKKGLQQSRTVLRKFPPNGTYLIQPADAFVIQKIKDEWRCL